MKYWSGERVETKFRWIWKMWGLEHPEGIDLGGEKQYMAEDFSRREGSIRTKRTWPISKCCLRQPFDQKMRRKHTFSSSFSFLFLKKLFTYLAAPGLRCSLWTLSCSMRDLISQPRIKPKPLSLGARSFSYWTTREVPSFSFSRCSLDLFQDIEPRLIEMLWISHQSGRLRLKS